MSRLKSRNKYFFYSADIFFEKSCDKSYKNSGNNSSFADAVKVFEHLNDKIAAIIVIDESNAILVLPKSVLNTSETALTVASPGNIATFATISINTPKPRIKQPTISDTTFIAYVSGCINPSKDIVKSMKNENNAIIGSCNKF